MGCRAASLMEMPSHCWTRLGCQTGAATIRTTFPEGSSTHVKVKELGAGVLTLMGMEENISRIDLILTDPSQADEIRKILPEGAVLVETSQQNSVVRSLSNSFETSLTAAHIQVLNPCFAYALGPFCF